MMGINNKEQLLEALADSFLQGFAADGVPMVYSIFDNLDRVRAQQINTTINYNIHKHFSQEAESFEISPIDFIQMCATNLELDSPEEVAQFLWHAGYMLGLLEITTQYEQKRKDEEDNQ